MSSNGFDDAGWLVYLMHLGNIGYRDDEVMYTSDAPRTGPPEAGLDGLVILLDQRLRGSHALGETRVQREVLNLQHARCRR